MSQKEFFRPELYISVSHQELERVIDALPNKADPDRNFDARVDHNQGFRAAPALTQLRSVADVKRNIPDLGVTYDEATGATRSRDASSSCASSAA